MNLFKSKNGQVSLDLALLILIILLLAVISYYNFLENNLNDDEKILSKINSNSAKAVNLVKSGVNGTYARYITYLGMNYTDKKNVNVYIRYSPYPPDTTTTIFINKTIYRGINPTTQNITINYVR